MSTLEEREELIASSVESRFKKFLKKRQDQGRYEQEYDAIHG